MSGAFALAGILLVAINMRVGLTQIGPVIEDIRADTGMSSATAGLLGSIPFLCYGAFAFSGASMVRRVGLRWTVIASLALMAAGTGARAAVTAPALMLAATIPIGVGVAILGVALAAVVKTRFPRHAAVVTGAYIAGTSLGAAGAASLTVPLADAVGSWRGALALGAALPLVAVPFWLGFRAPADRPARRPVRWRRPSRQAVVLGVVFGLQSLTFAVSINWVAAIYVEAGWTKAHAAFAVGSLPLLTVFAALAIAVLTSPRTRPLWVFATGMLVCAGLGGIALAPTSTPVLWLVLSGLGMGAIYPLVMTLPLDLLDRPADVADLTAWMLGLGYLIAATGPTLAGALRDATGGFTVPMLAAAACGLAAGILGLSPALRRSSGAP